MAYRNTKPVKLSKHRALWHTGITARSLRSPSHGFILFFLVMDVRQFWGVDAAKTPRSTRRAWFWDLGCRLPQSVWMGAVNTPNRGRRELNKSLPVQEAGIVGCRRHVLKHQCAGDDQQSRARLSTGTDFIVRWRPLANDEITSRVQHARTHATKPHKNRKRAAAAA